MTDTLSTDDADILYFLSEASHFVTWRVAEAVRRGPRAVRKDLVALDKRGLVNACGPAPTTWRRTRAGSAALKAAQERLRHDHP